MRSSTTMGPRRTILILLACACASSVPALAQRSFDPTRDLPGFEQVRSSEYKDLYPIDHYSDLLGKELSPADLAKVQAQWKAESGEVEAHLAELTTNPSVGTRWLLTQRMARHKFFSKVAFVVDDTHPPFLLFVQKPALDDPEYPPAVISMLHPFLAKLVEVFDARVAKAAAVKRRPDEPWTPIAILASVGDMQNYDRLGGTGGNSTNMRHDSALDLAVCWINSFDKPKASVDVLGPILRTVLTALIDDHVIPPAKELHSVWLQRGLAGALASPRTASVDALDKPQIRTADLRRLVDACHDANTRNFFLFPISKIITIKRWEDLGRVAFANGVPPGDRSQALWPTFDAQAALWMHFLLVPDNGRHRASFQRYLELAFKDATGIEAFTLSFPGVKPEDLDRQFWAWVYDEHERAFPDKKVDRGDLTDLFAKPVVAVDEIVDKARKSVANAAPPEPPFDPATLLITDKDVESRHGMALLQARSGDLEGAQAALEALAAVGPAVPEDGRIARDIERVVAARKLRDASLAALAQKQQRLSFEKDGKKLSLPVAKVEAGMVVFADNKQAVKSLPVTAIDPTELARISDKKEIQSAAPAWARSWVLLLLGDAKWDKSLKADSDAARDLKEDGNVWYRERLRCGEAARIVDDLAKKALPKTRAEAEPAVAALEELMSKYATTTCVLFKKGGLQRLARASLEVLSADVDPALALHGKVTPGQDGAISLAYEFDAPDEALDFVMNKGHLATWRNSFNKIRFDEASSTAEVKTGALEMIGGAMWRLPIGFSSPLTLRATYKFAEDSQTLHVHPHLAFQVFDDGVESYIDVGQMGDVHVRDAGTGKSLTVRSKFKEYNYERTYKIEIACDKGKVTVSIDGEVCATSDLGPRTSGGIELMTHCETPVLIDQLEITGKPEPKSLAALRSAWAERKLAAMGF